MTKPVLYAGLLGGLLGGVGGFALLRTFPSAARPAGADASAHPARPVADELFAHLKSGRDDAFFAAIRPGFAELDAEKFGKICQDIVAKRREFVNGYGAAGDIEFGREAVLGSSVVRFTYVERYARSCIVYLVTFYNTVDGWQVLTFEYKSAAAAFVMQ